MTQIIATILFILLVSLVMFMIIDTAVAYIKKRKLKKLERELEEELKKTFNDFGIFVEARVEEINGQEEEKRSPKKSNAKKVATKKSAVRKDKKTATQSVKNGRGRTRKGK